MSESAPLAVLTLLNHFYTIQWNLQ